jgi:hypothetical protein
MKSVFTETAKKKKPAQKILATVWLLKYGTWCKLHSAEGPGCLSRGSKKLVHFEFGLVTLLIFCQFVHSVEQTPSSEAHSTATHNILSLWNLQVHYRVQWSPPMVTMLSQLNPINIRSFNM